MKGKTDQGRMGNSVDHEVAAKLQAAICAIFSRFEAFLKVYFRSILGPFWSFWGLFLGLFRSTLGLL
jgi:hypothetical protein